MPPKKAPSKKTAVAKKTSTATPKKSASTPSKIGSIKKSATKATSAKPAGVTKRKTPSKTTSAAKKTEKAVSTPKHTRGTRSNDPKLLPPSSATPYHPEKDISEALYRLAGSDVAIRERAAELYRLYGGAAVKECGDDETTLLNACLNLVFFESEKSINPKGYRYTDDLEHRIGEVDPQHQEDFYHWMRQGHKMEAVIRPLLKKDQIERQKAFFALRNHLEGIDYGESKTEKERNRKARALAIYYKNNPTEGGSVVRNTPGKARASPKKTAAKMESDIKTPIAKASAEKTPSKPTGVTKKAALKSASTAET